MINSNRLARLALPKEAGLEDFFDDNEVETFDMNCTCHGELGLFIDHKDEA